MNYIYIGKIGDGKTYHVMSREILPALKAGRHVYTNIDGIRLRGIADYLGMDEELLASRLHLWENSDQIRAALNPDPEDKTGATHPVKHGALCVIDEAQKVWPARDFKLTTKGFMHHLDYHRHWGMDNVFITQNHKQMDAAIARLANDCYQVKNLKFLGKFLGHRYVLHRRDKPGDPVTSSTAGKFVEGVFRTYESARLRTDGTHESKGALSGGKFLFFGALLLYGVGSFVSRGGVAGMLGGKPHARTAVVRSLSKNASDALQVPAVQAGHGLISQSTASVMGSGLGLGARKDDAGRVRDLLAMGAPIVYVQGVQGDCRPVRRHTSLTFTMAGVTDHSEGQQEVIECIGQGSGGEVPLGTNRQKMAGNL